MRIYVRVKPGAKQSGVQQIGVDRYVVEVNAPAKDNKANIRLLTILAEYFGVPKTQIRFVSGLTVRDKVLTIGQ